MRSRYGWILPAALLLGLVAAAHAGERGRGEVPEVRCRYTGWWQQLHRLEELEERERHEVAKAPVVTHVEQGAGGGGLGGSELCSAPEPPFWLMLMCIGAVTTLGTAMSRESEA